MEPKPFAHVATIVRRRVIKKKPLRRGASLADSFRAETESEQIVTETIDVKRVGTYRDAERAAKQTRGFVSIVGIEAFTEERYKRVFGWGRM